jgi:hypothetical protein
MVDPKLELYYKELIMFARSVVVKIDLFGEHDKSVLKKEYGYTEVQDTDSPYYRHLAGEYGPFDTPIYISVDGVPKVLNKSLVLENPWLMSQYHQEGERFNSLVAEYPTRELLIRSILSNPERTLTEVIDADNFHVFSFNAEVLNSQEQMVLSEAVYNYVNMIKLKWYRDRYNYEHLYPASFGAVFFTGLVTALSDARYRAIRTNAAHDFHVWEYLANYGLDNYRDILTTGQQMFLYKNIDYLINRAGKVDTLAILIEELLKTNYLDVVTYKVALERELCQHYDPFEVADPALPECTEQSCLKINPVLIKQPINEPINSDDGSFEKQSFQYFYNRLMSDGLVGDRAEQYAQEDQLWYSKSDQTITDSKFVETQEITNYALKKKIFYQLAIPTIIYYWSIGVIKFDIQLNKTTDANLAIFTLLALLSPTKELPDTIYLYPVFKHPGVEITGSYGWFYSRYDFIKTADDTISTPVELLEHLLDITDAVFQDKLMTYSGNDRVSRLVRYFHNNLTTITNPNVGVNPKYSDSSATVQLGTDDYLLEAYLTEDLSLVTTVLDQLLPFDKVSLERVVYIWNRNETYQELTKLVAQLCSYNIAFVSAEHRNSSIVEETPKSLQPISVNPTTDRITLGLPSYIPISADQIQLFPTSRIGGVLKSSPPANWKTKDDRLLFATCEIALQSDFSDAVELGTLINADLTEQNSIIREYTAPYPTSLAQGDYRFYPNLNLAALSKNTTYHARVKYQSLYTLGRYYNSPAIQFNTGDMNTPTLISVSMTKNTTVDITYQLSTPSYTHGHTDILQGTRIQVLNMNGDQLRLIDSTNPDNWLSPVRSLSSSYRLPNSEQIKIRYQSKVYGDTWSGNIPVVFGTLSAPVINYQDFGVNYAYEQPTITQVGPPTTLAIMSTQEPVLVDANLRYIEIQYNAPSVQNAQIVFSPIPVDLVHQVRMQGCADEDFVTLTFNRTAAHTQGINRAFFPLDGTYETTRFIRFRFESPYYEPGPWTARPQSFVVIEPEVYTPTIIQPLYVGNPLPRRPSFLGSPYETSILETTGPLSRSIWEIYTDVALDEPNLYARIEQIGSTGWLPDEDLPSGELWVRVMYRSVNGIESAWSAVWYGQIIYPNVAQPQVVYPPSDTLIKQGTVVEATPFEIENATDDDLDTVEWKLTKDNNEDAEEIQSGTASSTTFVILDPTDQ